MTVRELIEELQKLEPDRLIVMSKDAEGNNFSPLDDCETGLYVPDSTWSGFFYDERHIADEGLDAVPAGAKPAWCLWPVN